MTFTMISGTSAVVRILERWRVGAMDDPRCRIYRTLMNA